MTQVRYSVEFNAKQLWKILEEQSLSSCVFVTTRNSEKEVKALAQALARVAKGAGRKTSVSSAESFSHEEDTFSVVYGANLLKNAAAVEACESGKSVILVEKYGVSTHRKVDEAVDLLRVQKSNVLGVVALK